MCVKPIYVRARNVVAPCGFCFLCRQKYRGMWAVRCMHEAAMHDENVFGTLTYRDEYLPRNGSLRKKHFQDFMKRLRVSIEPKKVRYYHAGEYGEVNFRPHYHFLLFGHSFDHHEPVPSPGGNPLYRSLELEALWPFGMCPVGEVSYESAAYVAGYVMKKVDQVGRKKKYSLGEDGELHEIEPEYSTMSRGGEGRGIGFSWWAKYGEEVERLESVRVMDREVAPPRYYDALLRERSDAAYEVMKLRRERKFGRYVCDNERMARELIARARLELASRRAL